MEHDALDALRRTSAAWRLVRADTAPLVLSFLGTLFVEENVRSIAETDLVARLDDHLYSLRADTGGQAGASASRYPRTPQAYIDHWAHPDQGWLRAWYPPETEEPHYDATPAVEQAVRWVGALRTRGFVGTESRLGTVFELLRELAVKSQDDPAERIGELTRRRRVIDEEIERIRSGEVEVLDTAAQRDRYQQLTHTAADLLGDLREVEANFRALDRQLRARIAGWQGAKGDLLDEVVAARDAIAHSDQGRSFHAFYDFLLDQGRQEEFAALVERVHGLAALDEENHDDAESPLPMRRLRRIHYDWLDAGERTQDTVRTLSEQLRRFLDDRVWLENRRVTEILRGVEAKALAAARHDHPPGIAIDALAPEICLPFERPLHTPRSPAHLRVDVQDGDADFEVDVLYEQVHVDSERVARAVHTALRGPGQVSLSEVVAAHPLGHGLAELVAYLSLSDPRFTVVHDEAHVDEVRWDAAQSPGGGLGERSAHFDRVLYVRRRAPGEQTSTAPSTVTREDRR